MLPEGILDYFEIAKIDEEVTNDKDETALQHDLFTFLSNKDGHGRKGTLVAAVKGTTVADVARHLEKTAIILHETDQQGVLSFSKNPVWLHKNMAVWHGAQKRGKTLPNCPEK